MLNNKQWDRAGIICVASMCLITSAILLFIDNTERSICFALYAIATLIIWHRLPEDK